MDYCHEQGIGQLEGEQRLRPDPTDSRSSWMQGHWITLGLQSQERLHIQGKARLSRICTEARNRLRSHFCAGLPHREPAHTDGHLLPLRLGHHHARCQNSFPAKPHRHADLRSAAPRLRKAGCSRQTDDHETEASRVWTTYCQQGLAPHIGQGSSGHRLQGYQDGSMYVHLTNWGGVLHIDNLCR